MSQSPWVAESTPYVVAHRGASKAERENTVAAFTAARRLGADGVELDVRLAAGGALVVHHDPTLAGGRPVTDVPPAQMPSEVPSLVEALDACDGLLVDVELKNQPDEVGFDPDGRLVDAVARVLDGYDPARMLVSSFHPSTLDQFRARSPLVSTGALSVGVLDPAAVRVRGHDAVHPHHRSVTARMVERAHAEGLAVLVWTVDRPSRMRRLAALGVDAIITNVPDVAIATLRA
jgi:glycerophosphoryl diester phosphodiesterase